MAGPRSDPEIPICLMCSPNFSEVVKFRSESVLLSKIARVGVPSDFGKRSEPHAQARGFLQGGAIFRTNTHALALGARNAKVNRLAVQFWASVSYTGSPPCRESTNRVPS